MLPSGEYSFDVAVATGTQESHSQQHWIHDALQLRASDESQRGGLIGLPMRKMDFIAHMAGEQ